MPPGGRPTAPSFLVIGAAKSGTTSLHEYLKQHPQIFMARVKEPNYFSFAGAAPAFRGPDDDGLACRATPDRLRVAKYTRSIWRLADYEALFQDGRRRPATGECSVSYLYFPEAPDRIRAALPDVRLVAVLRNPVDRAYSKFVQFAREGCEPLDGFAAALDAEDERIRRNWSPTWFYRERGFYAAQLERYYARFDRAQIRVFLYDDLVADPARVLREIFAFVGVDAGFTPNLSRRYNVSARPVRVPRLDWPDRLAASTPVNAGLRRVLPGRAVDLLQRAVTRANSRQEPWEAPPFDRSLRAQLVQVFRRDVEALARLIGRDLSAWQQA